MVEAVTTVGAATGVGGMEAGIGVGMVIMAAAAGRHSLLALDSAVITPGIMEVITAIPHTLIRMPLRSIISRRMFTTQHSLIDPPSR